ATTAVRRRFAELIRDVEKVVVSDRLREEELGAWRATTRVVDRKSTRLNSSHVKISYAVFCLKKKNKRTIDPPNNYAPKDEPQHTLLSNTPSLYTTTSVTCFITDAATPQHYTLPLHDALPISATTAVRRRFAELIRDVEKVVVSDRLREEELGAWRATTRV